MAKPPRPTPSPRAMQIEILMLTGERMTLEVESSDTVEQVKEKIHFRKGMICCLEIAVKSAMRMP